MLMVWICEFLVTCSMPNMLVNLWTGQPNCFYQMFYTVGPVGSRSSKSTCLCHSLLSLLAISTCWPPPALSRPRALRTRQARSPVRSFPAQEMPAHKRWRRTHKTVVFCGHVYQKLIENHSMRRFSSRRNLVPSHCDGCRWKAYSCKYV